MPGKRSGSGDSAPTWEYKRYGGPLNNAEVRVPAPGELNIRKSDFRDLTAHSLSSGSLTVTPKLTQTRLHHSVSQMHTSTYCIPSSDNEVSHGKRNSEDCKRKYA